MNAGYRGLLVRCYLPESRIEKKEGFSQRLAPRLGQYELGLPKETGRDYPLGV